MAISAAEITVPRALTVSVSGDTISVDLANGRTLAVLTAWFPRLLHATAAERDEWRLIANGEGIHWPKLDEDISIESLLVGRRSAESHQSLKAWLANRAA